MRITRAGCGSSSRSKKSSSTPVLLRENRLKLTPPSTTVAPRGEARLPFTTELTDPPSRTYSHLTSSLVLSYSREHRHSSCSLAGVFLQYAFVNPLPNAPPSARSCGDENVLIIGAGVVTVARMKLIMNTMRRTSPSPSVPTRRFAAARVAAAVEVETAPSGRAGGAARGRER